MRTLKLYLKVAEMGPLGSEITVLLHTLPADTYDIVVGLMNSVALMVLAYRHGTSSDSAHKTELLAHAPASKWVR